MHVELLIVGGGPAALGAATGYREAGGSGAVLLVGDEDTPPYFRPPLSKEYLRGESEEDELSLRPPSELAEQGIDLRLGGGVRSVDAAARRAVLADGTELDYTSCVLATGAAPSPLPVPGGDDPAVRYLRSVHDARRLRAAAATAGSAVVVGSGFIGCEAASSLARRGLRVTLLSSEPVPQQARLGAELGGRIVGWLGEDNVEYVGGTEVAGIESGRRVHRAGGSSVEADLVLVAAGVTPRGELARASAADMHGPRVVVDERMRSSVPGLFAAGDVAYARNAAAGRHLVVEHWGEAESMGAIAGTTAAGGEARWDTAPGFWTTVGEHTLKYVAWGDGYETASLTDHGPVSGSTGERGGAFTVRYSTGGVIVGVATHRADDDYDRAADEVQQARPAVR